MTSGPPDLVVAGAGMAGLVAAAEARRLGARPLVLEKLERTGGSMRLSSGVVWRHADFGRFRAECPDGDEALQCTLFERLDADLRWLEAIGAPVRERSTGSPATIGVRFEPEGLTGALSAAAGAVRLGTPLRALPDHRPVVLAGGGFAAARELLRRYVTPEADHLLVRAAPGATGEGLGLGLEAGAALSAGLDEVYGRNMPAPPAHVGSGEFVSHAQLYASHAEVTNARGERHEASSWAEIDVLQWTARQPRARAWFTVPRNALALRVRDRTIGEMVASAAAAGAHVVSREGAVTVETVAGVTTTLGGLRIDARAQAAPGVYAAGNDAGGIAAGGYASGLAAALVFGRIAARAALEDH